MDVQQRMAELRANYEAALAAGTQIGSQSGVTITSKEPIQIQLPSDTSTEEQAGNRNLGAVETATPPASSSDASVEEQEATTEDTLLEDFGLASVKQEAAPPAGALPEIQALQAQLEALNAKLDAAKVDTPPAGQIKPSTDSVDFDSLIENIVESNFTSDDDLDPDVVRGLLKKAFKPLMTEMQSSLDTKLESKLEAEVSRLQQEIATKSSAFDAMAAEHQQRLAASTRSAFLDAAQQKLEDHMGAHKISSLVERPEFVDLARRKTVPGTRISYADAISSAYSDGNVEDFSVLVKQLIPKSKSLSSQARPAHVGGSVSRGSGKEATPSHEEVAALVRRGMNSSNLDDILAARTQTVQLLQAFKPR